MPAPHDRTTSLWASGVESFFISMYGEYSTVCREGLVFAQRPLTTTRDCTIFDIDSPFRHPSTGTALASPSNCFSRCFQPFSDASV
jgi:hypothetical protein